MSTSPKSAAGIMTEAVRDCALPGCLRTAARGLAYCSVTHLLAAGETEGSA